MDDDQIQNYVVSKLEKRKNKVDIPKDDEDDEDDKDIPDEGDIHNDDDDEISE